MDSPIADKQMRGLVFEMVPTMLWHTQGVIESEDRIKQLRDELQREQELLDTKTENMVRYFDAFIEITEYSPLLDSKDGFNDLSYQRFVQKFCVSVDKANRRSVQMLYRAVNKQLFGEESKEAEDGRVVASSEGSTEPT